MHSAPIMLSASAHLWSSPLYFSFHRRSQNVCRVLFFPPPPYSARCTGDDVSYISGSSGRSDLFILPIDHCQKSHENKCQSRLHRAARVFICSFCQNKSPTPKDSQYSVLRDEQKALRFAQFSVWSWKEVAFSIFADEKQPLIVSFTTEIILQCQRWRRTASF